jgi:hypothetical protein
MLSRATSVTGAALDDLDTAGQSAGYQLPLPCFCEVERFAPTGDEVTSLLNEADDCDCGPDGLGFILLRDPVGAMEEGSRTLPRQISKCSQ